MPKLNCWEHKKCQRQVGGTKAAEMGVCPAAEESAADSIHGGINAGRSCWAVVGTLCGNNVQGSFASKLGNCKQCDFFKIVVQEEPMFMDNIDILFEIKQKKAG